MRMPASITRLCPSPVSSPGVLGDAGGIFCWHRGSSHLETWIRIPQQFSEGKTSYRITPFLKKSPNLPTFTAWVPSPCSDPTWEQLALNSKAWSKGDSDSKPHYSHPLPGLMQFSPGEVTFWRRAFFP